MPTILSVKFLVMDTIQTKMTCDFKGYTGHKGVDLIPNSTTETPDILSIADGTVIAIGNIKGTNSSTGTVGCGTYVAVKHGDGTISRYQHLKYNSLVVKKGQSVCKGQKLGKYGRPTTGNSTGCHLHFDISVPKMPNQSYIRSTFCNETRYYVDPKPYLLGTKLIRNSSLTTTPKRVSADALNVRRCPNGTKIDILHKGEIVNVESVSNGWAKIGTNRYVANQYLEEI